MRTIVQDARYAVRAAVASPGFAIAAVCSIALGIGANTTLFSVANALLLNPLPYADPDRLVILWNRSPGLNIAEDWFSTAQYFDVKNGHSGFEDVAIAIGGNDNLTGDGEPERLGTIRMSSNLLPMLGARPALGELFAAADDAPGQTGKALLGYRTWVRRYAADPRVLGRQLTINGQTFVITGVLPASFSLPREVMPTLNGAEEAEVVLPLPLAPDAVSVRGREDYNIVGKLKPGVSEAGAQAEMDTLTAALQRDHPDLYPPNGGLTFDIVPLQEQVVGDVRQLLLVLVAGVACVLLIACANVANLLLSRAVARQKEIAVRASLGASRSRIVSQLLTESLMLGLAGGALGFLLAFWGVDRVGALGQGSVPRLAEITIDVKVLLFTVTISLASGLLFGLAPALRVSRIDLQGPLRDSVRTMAGAGALWARGQQTRRLLVVAELAMSVMLMVGAGLLIRSFARVIDVPPGFNPARTLTLELSMIGRRYADAETVIQTYRRIWDEMGNVPGAIASGAVSALPLSQMFAWGPITVEGRTPQPGEEFINVDQRFVGGDYFRAMEIPLLRGRPFGADATRANPRVAIIEQRMADQLWPGEEALGRRIRIGGADSKTPWITIVGIVGNVKQYTLDGDSRMAMYLPHAQYPVRGMNLVLRTASDPASVTTSVRQRLREIDPDLPVYRVRTMEERVDESLARRRFAMVLLGLFAAVALGLASIGIYGVVAYLVAQGTRELGIRLALGATPRDIVRMIVGGAMTISSAGIALGLVGAWIASRAMRALLFGVDARDPLTFVAIPIVLAVVAFAACYVPARRVTGIDPATCLRND